MTEAPPARSVSTLAAEPAQRVGGRWIALIALANLGLYLGYIGPISVLLPNQVQAIAGPAHKVVVLGWVTAIGAAMAMVANPVAGALSDRTTSRFGRRRPWIVCGALAGAAALCLLAGQHTIAGIIAGWCLAQAGLNAMQASVTAGVPDHVPVGQRGVVSGWIGLPQTLGVLLAVVLVTDVVSGNAGYVLPSAAGRAKDLGIINIANSGPQVLAPAIAAPLVTQLGGYPALYLFVAVCAVLGSAFVWRIRSVP